jgi:hypothetical protein
MSNTVKHKGYNSKLELRVVALCTMFASVLTYSWCGRSISKLLDSKSVQYNLAGMCCEYDMLVAYYVRNTGAQRMRLQSSVHTLERRQYSATSALSFLMAVTKYTSNL